MTGRAHARVGEALVVEMDPAPAGALPEGAVWISATRTLEWTPRPGQVGEHAFILGTSGSLELFTVFVEPADARPVHFEGCDCMGIPDPPYPSYPDAGISAVAGLAIGMIWIRRRRIPRRRAP